MRDPNREKIRLAKKPAGFYRFNKFVRLHTVLAENPSLDGKQKRIGEEVQLNFVDAGFVNQIFQHTDEHRNASLTEMLRERVLSPDFHCLAIKIPVFIKIVA